MLAQILFSTYHFAKWPSYPFHNGFFSTMTLLTIFHTLSHMPSYESISISSRSLHPSHVYTDCSLASPFLCPISILLYITIIDSYHYTMSHHSTPSSLMTILTAGCFSVNLAYVVLINREGDALLSLHTHAYTCTHTHTHTHTHTTHLQPKCHHHKSGCPHECEVTMEQRTLL